MLSACSRLPGGERCLVVLAKRIDLCAALIFVYGTRSLDQVNFELLRTWPKPTGLASDGVGGAPAEVGGELNPPLETESPPRGLTCLLAQRVSLQILSRSLSHLDSADLLAQASLFGQLTQVNFSAVACTFKRTSRLLIW